MGNVFRMHITKESSKHPAFAGLCSCFLIVFYRRLCRIRGYYEESSAKLDFLGVQQWGKTTLYRRIFGISRWFDALTEDPFVANVSFVSFWAVFGCFRGVLRRFEAVFGGKRGFFRCFPYVIYFLFLRVLPSTPNLITPRGCFTEDSS